MNDLRQKLFEPLQFYRHNECLLYSLFHLRHCARLCAQLSLPLYFVFKVLWCLEQREHSDLLLRTLFRGVRAPLPSCIRWTHGHHDIHGPWERRKQTASIRSKIMCTDLFMSLFVQRLARPLLTGLKCCWCLLLTSPDKHTHVHTHTERERDTVSLGSTFTLIDLKPFFLRCQSNHGWCTWFLMTFLHHLQHIRTNSECL